MSPPSHHLKVIVADDDPLVRAGIIGILTTDPALRVIAEAADGDEALELTTLHSPDVLLLDIQMPTLSGLDVLKRIRTRSRRTPCLIVTTFGEDDYIFEAIRADADGFVLKSGDPRQLLSAVHAVADDGAFFSPAVARRLIDFSVVSRFDEYSHACRAVEELTAREQEILLLLSRGATNAEIAQTLHLATGTVKVHVSSILRRTGARNRVEAALIAVRAHHI